jgi:magnesium-transporting ATPase (P-type)
MIIGTYAPKVFDSPLTPFSTMGPLILVLAITMIKEGLEDVKRHRSDREVNNRTAEVIYPKNSTGTKKMTWRDLQVGHLVKVYTDHEAPADVIVLQSAYEGGACYIETSNIDGETDLKLKTAVPEIANHYKDPAEIRGTFECDHPNDFLHVFNGAIKCFSSESKRPETYGVTAKNVVLRGSRLRNTDWIIGLVVYTGKDTKVMKKGGSVRSKLSKIEKTMNKCLMIIFSAQFILCSMTTVAAVLWETVNSSNLEYLDLGGTNYGTSRP